MSFCEERFQPGKHYLPAAALASIMSDTIYRSAISFILASTVSHPVVKT